MGLLVPPSTGIAINTATPLIIFNKDPVFVANNLMTTIYAWATEWDTAQVQIEISPQVRNSQFPVVWFPVGAMMTTNRFFTFQHRWGQMRAVVTNASANTAGLTAILFQGL
jgi:hypothetical protein